jgi:hypothetical protein
MPAGCHRSVSPEPEEMIKLGEEMIKWVKENDPYHLSQWYCGIKGIIFSTWETMRKRPEFIIYYENAMRLIGNKYIRKDSEIEPSLKHRFLRLYFKDLRKQEDNDLDAAAERSQKIAQSSWTPEMLEKHDAFIAQMSSLSSNRNIDESMINNDKKS